MSQSGRTQKIACILGNAFNLIVELATILDKTQVWPRKSILYVQIPQNLIAKYFLLIRDNHKPFFGDESLNLQLDGAGK